MGVVVCQSIGGEYFAHHKVMVQLADMLARQGAPCVRFDYTGCGDSEGSMEAMDVSRWLGDIGRMADRLRSRSAVEKICLCGFRLGAALAAMYGSQTGGTERLVLWDPVVSGRRYVNELRKAHKRWLRGSFAKARRGDRALQELGFPCRAQLRRQLEAIDLVNLPSPPAREVMILHGGAEEGVGELSRRWERAGADVDLCVLPAGALALSALRAVAKRVLK